MISAMEWPLVRRVLLRTASLILAMLFVRGHLMARSNPRHQRLVRNRVSPTASRIPPPSRGRFPPRPSSPSPSRRIVAGCDGPRPCPSNRTIVLLSLRSPERPTCAPSRRSVPPTTTSWPGPVRLSPIGQVSPVHSGDLPAIPSPPTPRSPAVAFARYPSARRASRIPPGLGFAFHSQARRNARPNRVRLLRTGRLPPGASHPASRRRSGLWLRGWRAPAPGGLSPLGRLNSRAHSKIPARWRGDAIRNRLDKRAAAGR